jgi:dTDP-4-amino-4,6-dideoxygalactose transaminase
MYERYHHDVVGVNSRLDSIQAAVLKRKVAFTDLYNKARQDAARKYSVAFEGHKNIAPKYVIYVPRFSSIHTSYCRRR